VNPLKIEIGDTVESSVGINKGAVGVCIDICFGGDGTYKISWDDYNDSWVDFKDLTLIKKGNTVKEFTKSDLKTGMFVQYRNGDYRIVIGDMLSGDGYATLSSFDEGLKYRPSSKTHYMDIIAVYKAGEHATMANYLAGRDLTLIWERTEQTEAQKEMEVLQKQAKALQEQITKLQGKL
jgi:hypothetical protein